MRFRMKKKGEKTQKKKREEGREYPARKRSARSQINTDGFDGRRDGRDIGEARRRGMDSDRSFRRKKQDRAARREFTTIVIHTCASIRERTQMPTLIRSRHTRSAEHLDCFIASERKKGIPSRCATSFATVRLNSREYSRLAQTIRLPYIQNI